VGIYIVTDVKGKMRVLFLHHTEEDVLKINCSDRVIFFYFPFWKKKKKIINNQNTQICSSSIYQSIRCWYAIDGQRICESCT